MKNTCPLCTRTVKYILNEIKFNMGCEGYYKVYDLVKITKDGLLDLFLFLFNHNSVNSYYYDDISSFNLFVMDEYLEDEEKNVQYYEENTGKYELYYESTDLSDYKDLILEELEYKFNVPYFDTVGTDVGGTNEVVEEFEKLYLLDTVMLWT
jgi:hypothetical protein